MPRYIKWNLVAVVVFLVDRVLKIYFQKNPYEVFAEGFLNNMLSFHFESNPGIAFGIPVNAGLLLALIFFIMLFLSSVILGEYKKNNFLEVFSLGLVMAGALSNLIDRLRFGYVVDYIDVTFFTVFNLADAMITVGVVIFAIAVFSSKDLDKKSGLR